MKKIITLLLFTILSMSLMSCRLESVNMIEKTTPEPTQNTSLATVNPTVIPQSKSTSLPSMTPRKNADGEYYFMDVCPPYNVKDYSGSYRCKTYLSSEGQSFLMVGNKYSDGMTIAGHGSYALFNLNGKYKTVKFTLGPDDNATNKTESAVISFVVDGNNIAEYKVEPDSYIQDIVLPVNNGLQLKIMITEGYRGIGLGDMTVE